MSSGVVVLRGTSELDLRLSITFYDCYRQPNRVCFLGRAGVDRFAVSVLWELTPTLTIIPEKTWFGRTVIRSAHALTYYQAQRMVDGKPADEITVDTLVCPCVSDVR